MAWRICNDTNLIDPNLKSLPIHGYVVELERFGIHYLRPSKESSY